jgi:hypothetical protein
MFLDLACHIVLLHIVPDFTKWRVLEFILYVCKRSYLFLVLSRLSYVINDSVCSLIFITSGKIEEQRNPSPPSRKKISLGFSYKVQEIIGV